MIQSREAAYCFSLFELLYYVKLGNLADRPKAVTVPCSGIRSASRKLDTNVMKIELPKNYTIELEVTSSSCFGRIYHPGIRHYVNKIGYFIASINEENQTFVKSLVLDLRLRNDLKFDPRKNISVDARDPQGFAGPDKELLEELSRYQISNLAAYSSELPKYVVDAVRGNFNSSLPIGLNLSEISEGRFIEYGSLWKEDA